MTDYRHTQSGDLPPARCEVHAHNSRPAPCGACMRAQQQRLAAHQRLSVAAARAWQTELAASGARAAA